ncbi:MAG: hypothetical protein HY834_00695 [Devosia nanyangense]|uniref:Uncharacterized protein n=1 Tax=Devosia nanyangense TaxID=1228055 RepID=A0A933NWR3_9HYPH|nr:hypothetical protein [Devosia nanyangense]
MAKTTDGSSEGGGKEAGALAEFLAAVTEFVANSSAMAAKAVGDVDTSDIISANSDILSGHMKSFSEHIMAQYSSLSDGQKAEVNNAVIVMGGTRSAQIGTDLATKKFSLAKSWKNLLKWLSQHLVELKKVIEAIVTFIFDLLGKEVPKWIHDLVLLIDEIYNFIMSLVGGEKGENQARLADELSAAEVNYWNEKAAVARFVNASRQDKHSRSEE